MIAAGIFLLTRRRRSGDVELIERFESLDRAQEREERMLREEAARSREEAQSAAKAQREELNAALQNLGESNLKSIAEIGAMLKGQLETVSTQTGKLTESNELRLESLRSVVDLRLKQLQEDNSRQIEKMRATVDEKLQGTLEKRLGESFQARERSARTSASRAWHDAAAGERRWRFAARADECQSTRWLGRSATGRASEEVLAPEQFARNVRTREGSGENRRVRDQTARRMKTACRSGCR